MKTLGITSALLAGVLLSACATAGHEYGRVYDSGYGSGYGGDYGAYDRAQVLSAEPIYNAVRTPVSREVCWDEPVRHVSRGRGSTAGTILGGLLGGLAGHQIGSGSGNTAATVVGAIAGVAVGQRVTSGPTRQYRSVETRCRIERDYHQEQRLSGYHVTYLYNGQTYTTRTPRHPGEWIQVRVSVVPAE